MQLNQRYQLCLVQVQGNVKFEAARRIRKFDDISGKRACVFEIITGKVHFECNDRLLNYDYSMISKQRRDLQFGYNGKIFTFPKDHYWDNTVIRALRENVMYKSRPVEKIAALPKQRASIIKFKDEHI